MGKKSKKEETVKETAEETVTEETNEEILEEETKEPFETEKLQVEVQNLKDQLLRNQAELQNFKRRMNEERIKDRIHANSELVKRLLTPLDNFEIGLANEVENGQIKPEIKGFEMIRRDLMHVLNDEGLEEIDPLEAPFDPKYHQAVAKEAKEDVESNTVIEVYQKGYVFKDRVIRPAMVKVSE